MKTDVKPTENTAENGNKSKPLLVAVISDEEIENKLIELGYVDSLDEFEEPTWDEGRLYWARKAFVEGVKWANSH